MGSANVEPPPLLFGQRSVSPPSFTSTPLSPGSRETRNHQSPQTSHTDNQDIEMSTSITLQPPAGQNHDREDHTMSERDGVTEAAIGTSAAQENHVSNAALVVGEGAAENNLGESMEIVDEGPPAPVESSPTAQDEAESPVASTAPQAAANHDQQPTQTNDTTENRVSTDGAAESEQAPDGTQQQITQQRGNTSTSDEPQSQNSSNDASQDSSNSSDDSDSQPTWQPLPEDPSVPDEAELKWIEEQGNEHSGLDRKLPLYQRTQNADIDSRRTLGEDCVHRAT